MPFFFHTIHIDDPRTVNPQKYIAGEVLQQVAELTSHFNTRIILKFEDNGISAGAHADYIHEIFKQFQYCRTELWLIRVELVFILIIVRLIFCTGRGNFWFHSIYDFNFDYYNRLYETAVKMVTLNVLFFSKTVMQKQKSGLKTMIFKKRSHRDQILVEWQCKKMFRPIRGGIIFV
jgi:hypothetical protein